MAKIRVYELARDLNMTNKELIEKLNEMGFPVLTHTNSLEPDEVVAFKNRLNKKPASSVEETRVRPTVIRRRKKSKEDVVEKTHEPEAAEISTPEAAEESEETAAETPVMEDEVAAKADESPAPEEVVAGAEELPARADGVSEETATPVEGGGDEVAQPAAGAKKAGAESAKIIRRPPVPEPPEPAAQEPEPVAAAEPPDEPGADAEAEVEETEAESAAGVPEDTAAPVEAEPEEQEKPVKPATKKRRKKDTPAKIIKMGPRPVPSEAGRAQDGGVPEAGTPRGGGAGKAEAEEGRKLTAKEKKKKGGRRGAGVVEEEIAAPKKKVSFRKKAVVEGVELYSKDNRSRKQRKGEKGKKALKGAKPQITVPKAIKRRIKIDETIVLAELAKRMGIKANEIIGKLMGLGVMATVNQTVDFETAVLVASEFDYEVERAGFEENEFLQVAATEDDPGKLLPRPPVVTVMGHVDHGKTSLLDVIRKTSVTEQEAGGITQHIGAYNVTTEKGQIVFLDTPGHEAFTAMRSRGASVTDIVILVVAADDGVMPQTVEAVNHSKAAEVPIIVAINKMDKPGAEPDRVQRELAEIGLTPEDWGGDTIFMKVSAKQGTGIEDLLEMVLLQADMLELKANPDKLASGHVIEAKLDSGRGPVATVLVQDGTLQAGQPVVCGLHHGRIRALINDRGQQVDSAGPSMPVEIIGISGVPNAGDEFVAVADEKSAKQVSQNRMQKQRAKELARTNRLNLDNLFERMQEGEVKDLNLIIKADVNGSIEALKDSLGKLSNEEVKINVVHSATGAISEHDVSLSAVSDAIIIGFNVRPNAKVQALAADENVSIRYYDIIYNVIQDIQNAILGLMASTFEDKTLGNAEVREVFHVPKIGAIAGSYVTDGKIQRGQKARLVRDGVVLYDGKIGSLRRFKDDVREVATGFECGIGIENYNDIKIGDIIECYTVEEIKPHL